MIKAAIQLNELEPASLPKAVSAHRFEWVASICITVAVVGLHFRLLGTFIGWDCCSQYGWPPCQHDVRHGKIHRCALEVFQLQPATGLP